MNLEKLYFTKGKLEKIYKCITRHPDYIFYKAVKAHKKYRNAKNNNQKIKKILYSFKANRYSSKYNLELYGDFGKNLKIWHGNIIINGKAKLGNNVQLHGNNCIGETRKGVPKIGDNVDIGYGATIIGPITIANNVIIGANALVNTSILEENSIFVGNPAKNIKND